MLLCFSLNTITRMCQFLKENKSFVMELYTDIGSKGFSEDCKMSLIHQVVFTLTNLLKTSTEEKVTLMFSFKKEYWSYILSSSFWGKEKLRKRLKKYI